MFLGQAIYVLGPLQIGDDFACVVEQPRHHQVAHYHAPKRKAIFVDPQIV